MHPTVVLDVVGLTPALMGTDTPNLNTLAREGVRVPIHAITPAVTCSAQATFLTGTLPREHGIVGNGWYFRDLAQVMFWKQSNQLVQREQVWDAARRREPACTCAQMFWWFNMYGSADWSVTPRPMYPADGRKIPDIYTHPASLHGKLTAELGAFPLFNFWGPTADMKSSRWIADASLLVDKWHSPTVLFVYLPHLDYNLQRLGPSDPRVRQDVRDIDALCGQLIAQFRTAGRRVLVLSEYGIGDVQGPIHINRALREAKLLAVRDELGLEMLDAGASEAFAAADHQVAHVYVRQPANIAAVKNLIAHLPGVEGVFDRREQLAFGLDHERSGELVAIANPDRWFTYYYWLDDRVAPDFARTVDIHRKPGYDPVELFVDPALRFPKLRVAARLAQKVAGFRYLMDVTPLDAALVRGSHGRVTDTLEEGPVLLSSEASLIRSEVLESTDVRDVILAHVFEN
jgi:predicted AlkP superfamily pyrophosphatase or phosphodiesterase